MNAFRVVRIVLVAAVTLHPLFGYSQAMLPFATSEEREAFEKRSYEMQVRKATLEPLRERVQGAEKGDATVYVEAKEEYLAQTEGIAREFDDIAERSGLRQELAGGYLELGYTARFKLRDVERATAYFETALKYGGPGNFAIADMLQFDLGDKAKAAARLRRIDTASIGRDVDWAYGRLVKSWLAHQIEYLEKGTVFHGAFSPGSDCGGLDSLMLYGALWLPMNDPLGIGRLFPFNDIIKNERKAQAGDGELVATKLAQLPSSSIVLMLTAGYVSALPDAGKILEYLRRNDPAGFASACYFAMLELPHAAVGGALRKAAAQFKAKHGIQVKADPRLSTPENTWQFFLDSLGRGAIDDALACLTPAMQATYRPRFTSMPREQLRGIVDSFTKFALTTPPNNGMAEAIVNRGERGPVGFVLLYGDWKIHKM
jgi:hypothetical protein